MQHHISHQQGAHQVAHQHHRPEPQQAPDVLERGFAHDWQHGGQGVFGKQLLTGQDDRQKPRAVAEAGDNLEAFSAGQARIEQAHSHQRQAHRQPGGQCRPEQRGDAAFQFLIALLADDFVQHRGARWLVLDDVVLFFSRQVGGLA